MRYQKKHVYQAFANLCAGLGQKYNVPDQYNSNTFASQWLWCRINNKNVANVGAWFLDYAPIYGGWVICEMHNEDGGESRPMGDARMSTGEFMRAIQFASRALLIRSEKERAAS